MKRLALFASAAVLLAGCGAGPPSPSPSLTSVPSMTSASSARPTSGPTLSPIAVPDALKLDIHSIGPPYTVGMFDATTDGEAVYWSANMDGDPAFAPDLMMFAPGAAEPRLIYRSEARDSSLVKVAAGGGHLAVVDQNDRLYGRPGWRLLYFDSSGIAEPATIDATDLPPGSAALLPRVALSEDHMVWTTAHWLDNQLACQLLHRDLVSHSTDTLASSDCDSTEYWYPDLDGSRLVFGTVEYAASDTHDDRHVFLADLSDAEWNPVQLDDDGIASMPVIGNGFVAWKIARRIYNMRNWGRMALFQLPHGPEEILGASELEYINEPSMGSHWITAQETNYKTIYVVDPATREVAIAVDRSDAADHLLVGPHVAGSMLVARDAVTPVGEPGTAEVIWAILPP